MVLRMKIFNILGIYWKIWLLLGEGGGGSRNTNIEGGLQGAKVGIGQFVNFRGDLVRKRDVVFLRGDDGWYPNAHYESGPKFEEKFIFCFKNDKNLVKFDLNTKK